MSLKISGTVQTRQKFDLREELITFSRKAFTAFDISVESINALKGLCRKIVRERHRSKDSIYQNPAFIEAVRDIVKKIRKSKDGTTYESPSQNIITENIKRIFEILEQAGGAETVNVKPRMKQVG